ncbi:MAG: hypothetical protein ACLFVX_10285 [Archaeoglobaceae archaeon]
MLLVSGCTQLDEERKIEINGQEVSTDCEVDEDCVLVDRQLNYSSCWPGACEEVDYSLPKYVAVNEKSFKDFKEKVGPPEDECGPQPLCPIRIINDNFTARCIDNTCKKVPNEK